MPHPPSRCSRRSFPGASVSSIVALATLLGCESGTGTPEIDTVRKESAALPGPWFEDATDALGIDFVHEVGGTAEYFMPDAIGSGAAVLDFDADGRLDLYLVSNSGREGAKNRLYRQNEDGTFTDVSTGSGLDVPGHGMGCAAGDLDNDGLPELLLTEYGRTRLFWNRGDGRFVDVSEQAGIDNPAWGTSAAFFDADRDGWLDIVVANYVLYSASRPCSDQSGRRDFCGPAPFPDTVDRLFRNTTGSSDRTKGPRFVDITVTAGLGAAAGPGLGVVSTDFDGDGRPDIFIANDGKPNHLWMQQPDGTFVEEAVFRGLAYNAEGRTQADMGVAVGDVDGDGLFDVYVTHLTEELHSLWRQGPRGSFRDESGAFGFASMRERRTGFGAVLADFDLDGDLDLAQVNGRVKFRSGPGRQGERFWAAYEESNQLFESTDGAFRDVSRANDAFCGTPNVARGLISADLDSDGALDLVITRTGERARVYRNVGGLARHWLLVRAVDPELGGRDAYGAEIRVETPNARIPRVICPSQSYLVSGDPRAHFGLGESRDFTSIEVSWPGGPTETFPGGAADRVVVIAKGSGKPARERLR